MRTQFIEQWLADTLIDFKLSQSEALELRELLPQLEGDDISFVRNKAFALAREPVRAGGDNAVASLIWLEKLIKIIDSYRQAQGGNKVSAHFSPGDDCRRKLIDLCVGARQSLDISVFTISDNRLSDAVMAAYARGVSVRVITDNDKAEDNGSDVDALAAQGIMVRMDNSSNHMHHKFALVDQQILVNGSFNWTRSASDYNHENILVTDDARLVSAYLREFENLWQEFS